MNADITAAKKRDIDTFDSARNFDFLMIAGCVEADESASINNQVVEERPVDRKALYLCPTFNRDCLVQRGGLGNGFWLLFIGAIKKSDDDLLEELEIPVV